MTDRMPAVSASQVLQTAVNDIPKPISLGLKSLDNAAKHSGFGGNPTTGLPRGRLTELFGPPGVGKTSLWYACTSNHIPFDNLQSKVWRLVLPAYYLGAS